MRIQKPTHAASEPTDDPLTLYIRFSRLYLDDKSYRTSVRRLMDRSGLALSVMINQLPQRTDRALLYSALHRRVPVVIELCTEWADNDMDTRKKVTHTKQIVSVEDGLQFIKDHLPPIKAKE